MIKFSFNKSSNNVLLSSQKGTITYSGMNSHIITPAGSVINLAGRVSSIVDDKITPVKGDISDLNQKINGVAKNIKDDLKGKIKVINNDIKTVGDKYTYMADEFGSSISEIQSTMWTGRTLNNNGWLTGYQFGSSVDSNGVYDSFFGINANNFYIGRGFKSDEPTTDNDGRDLPYATLFTPGTANPVPAFAVGWSDTDKQYNIAFNGVVNFSNLANGNGETIINGGLIDTDTVVANRIAIGMSNMSKYLGEFSKAPGDNGIYTDNIDPHVFDHYEIKSGDSYFDIPTGMLMVYDGDKWYGNKGEDGQSSSGYDMLLSDANVVISRSASGEWVTDKAQTGVKIMFGLLDVTNKFELSLEDTTNFSFASNDDVKFTTEVSKDIVKPQYSTNVIAKPLSGGVKLYFLSYTINNSNDLAIVRGYTSYNSKVTIFDTDKVKIIGSCSTTDKIESFEINVPISHKGTKEYLIEATDFLNNKIYSKISIYRDTIVCGGSILNSDKTLFTYVKEPNSKIKVKISDGADNSVTKTFYPNDEDTNTVDISSYNFSSDATAHSTLTDSRGLVSEYDDTIVDKLTDLDSISNMPENSISALEIKQKFSVYGLEDGTGYSLQLDKLQLKLLGNGEFNHADGAYVVKYKVLKTTGASAVEMKSGFKVTAIPYKENGDILDGDSNTVVGDNTEGSFTLSEDQLKKETDTVMVNLEVLIDNTYVLVDKQPMTVLFNPGSPYVVDLDNDTHICPSNAEGGEVLVTECNTTVSVWLGVNKYSIDGVDITMTGNGKKVDRGGGVDQVEYTITSNKIEKGTVTISVSHYGADAPDSVALKIQPYKTADNNVKVNVGNPIVFSISKGKQGFTGGSGDVYN